MGKKYVITGATSFIGSKITRELLTRGDVVYAVCRPNSPNINVLPVDDNLKLIFADADNIETITNEITEADIFINLAWKGTNHLERDNENINRTNIANTLNAMRCAKSLNCDMFVETGSQAEYGYQYSLTDENAECNPFSAYGKAKLQTYLSCRELASEIGIKYVHLRIFSVYGEGDHDYTLFKSCLMKMLNNEPIDLTAGTQLWNFLYVDDAAKIIIGLMDNLTGMMQKGDTEIVNVASDDTRPLSEFISQMKLILKSDSQLKFGVIRPERLLSIIPNIKKLDMILGQNYEQHSFEDGVKLSKMRLNRILC